MDDMASMRRVRDFLFPGAAERDEGFLQEVLRLSHTSLRLTGIVEMVVPVLLVVVQWLVVADSEARNIIMVQAGCIILIGLATYLAGRAEWSYERSRLLALISIWLVGMVLVNTSLIVVSRLPGTGHYVPGRITALMMVVVATIPVQPIHTFLLGASIGGYYFLALLFAQGQGMVTTQELDVYDHAFMAMITLISSVLTAIVYDQRVSNYRAYMQALEASLELRAAQSQVLLSESAASLGRLAAALSHELNTPLGVLKSAVDTLMILGGKLVNSDASAHKRLLMLQAELGRSIHSSAERLQEIVGRMQRFTNLDRAEVQRADLADLLRDVVALHEPKFREKAEIELRLDPMPPITCRPQQLSAVFSNLISNAVEACNGDGRIVVSSHARDQDAEVTIEDNGRGLSTEESAGIFDPGFKVASGRVATGNWSLFGSRQIIHDHGGDIRITSRPGVGTTVSVTLPFVPPAMARSG